MKKHVKCLAILSLIINLLLNIAVVIAPPSDPDIVVPRMKYAPVIDGIIGTEEWGDAVKVSTLAHFYNRTPPYDYLGNRSAFLYFKHDCLNLYIAIVVEDPIENITIWSDPSNDPEIMGDSIWVFYDVSGDMSTGPGDDEKGLAHPDFSFDGALIPTPPGWSMDTDLGGSKNIQGSSKWGSGFLTYEFSHPLNSQDVLGNDPSLTPGDTILAEINVMDPEFGNNTYGWIGRYDLNITECPSIGGALTTSNTQFYTYTSIILTIIIIPLTVIYFKKTSNKIHYWFAY
jgi:hypothetical protein